MVLQTGAATEEEREDAQEETGSEPTFSGTLTTAARVHASPHLFPPEASSLVGAPAPQLLSSPQAITNLGAVQG